MRRICFVVFVTILLLSCTTFAPALTPTPSLPAPAETPNPLPEPTDRTQVITAAPGQTFDIVLPSNSTTGYRWRLASPPDANIVEPVGQTYIAEQTGNLGSGGVEVWTFSAVNPGETTIQFGYDPPANDAQPEETTIFTVRVE